MIPRPFLLWAAFGVGCLAALALYLSGEEAAEGRPVFLFVVLMALSALAGLVVISDS